MFVSSPYSFFFATPLICLVAEHAVPPEWKDIGTSPFPPNFHVSLLLVIVLGFHNSQCIGPTPPTDVNELAALKNRVEMCMSTLGVSFSPFYLDELEPPDSDDDS